VRTRAHRFLVTSLVLPGACLLLFAAADKSVGQTELPKIQVEKPKEAKRAPPAKKKQVARPVPVRAPAPAPRRVVSAPRPAAPAPAATPTPQERVADTNRDFDRAREQNILPKGGASAHTIDRAGIEAAPQGENTPVDKLLLAMPGVTQDSAASGLLHVRNEHGNVQYRINGILIPDGVSGFGQLLDSGFIRSITLLTGALPAQYGLHTAGIVDMVSKTQPAAGEGAVSVYGGSHGTFTPSIQYGGVVGQTEYFFIGRYLTNAVGIENPAPTYDAIHDVTKQTRYFGYTSTILDDTTRFVTMSGAYVAKFQIPNRANLPPVFCDGCTGDGQVQIPGFTVGDTFNSAALNENQIERNYFGIAAVQKKVNDVDMQLAYFTRYSSVHFVPDVIGDLTFNGVASDVFRSSLVNGLQGDVAWRPNAAHTLRFGMIVQGEYTQVTTLAQAFATDATGAPLLDASGNGIITSPILDTTSKWGTTYGTYIQDEWRITNQLTVIAGLRFDEMVQFVTANQLSPRVALIYKPWEETTVHVGYARTFTPPSQVIATPANYNLFNNTTAQAAINVDPNTGLSMPTRSDPVLPERANVYDAGVTKQFRAGPDRMVELGVDAYYKTARDLLDDGQFGQAYVLSGFNYERAENVGVEGKIIVRDGNFLAYGNLAWARQLGTNIVSNQFLFAPDELAFISKNWIYTDHAQTWTASAGASYKWIDGTRVSASMIFGSGLRSGDFNSSHVPSYYQINAGISHEYQVPWGKPFTLRFDVLNVLDQVYELRDGSGIGVFAPQFGPRRTYLVGLSQKI
jgi:outer membrane receptor protein involved in Fe transport